MNYNEVKGPNTLAEFLMDGLSDETLLRIYKEKTGVMFMTGDPFDSPILSLRAHVRNLFYTAAWNLVANMYGDELISEACQDHILNE